MPESAPASARDAGMAPAPGNGLETFPQRNAVGAPPRADRCTWTALRAQEGDCGGWGRSGPIGDGA